MIIHMDMDAFYASVEEREDPSLVGKPLVVGGDADGRGVVATANYAARKFGIRSAMSAAEAKRRCPHAIFLRPHMGLYQETSRAIFAIAERYTPLIEPLSLDEAFLDVRSSQKLFGPVEAIARRVKDEIRAEQSLTVSMGIGPNKLVAKIASDLEKPDGFTVVRPEEVQPLLDSLPIRRLWGVGKVTGARLEAEGIRTVADLRVRSERHLSALVGDFATELLRRARGEDDRPVNPHSEAKSISHENTFARDVDDHSVLASHVVEFAEKVGARIRRKGLKARTVTLKLRFPDFRLITRARSLGRASDNTDDIVRLARRLLDDNYDQGTPIRLLGVGVSGFDDESFAQEDLFAAEPRGDSEAHKRRVDSVADAIQNRFGDLGLKRARGIRKSED